MLGLLERELGDGFSYRTSIVHCHLWMVLSRAPQVGPLSMRRVCGIWMDLSIRDAMQSALMQSALMFQCRMECNGMLT